VKPGEPPGWTVEKNAMNSKQRKTQGNRVKGAVLIHVVLNTQATT